LRADVSPINLAESLSTRIEQTIPSFNKVDFATTSHRSQSDAIISIKWIIRKSCAIFIEPEGRFGGAESISKNPLIDRSGTQRTQLGRVSLSLLSLQNPPHTPDACRSLLGKETTSSGKTIALQQC